MTRSYNPAYSIYCYYIEFIGQISENGHKDLQLNSKDALHLIRKAIFQINNAISCNIILEIAVKYFSKKYYSIVRYISWGYRI